ncbi:MAG: PIN domain-containing protein [Natronospirillum sp.]|uniref:PIN domain-containing protein n=1 Tax=Natronospirillum sp. TaxID=2812955 RepID=UPI0025FAFFEB|nr:PIN domain-containing protein [Natronospirillum sp.]MCH8552994.1 PIN domain-containing protein [Natronospirillum sp.]
MGKFTVVYDACVLYPAPLRDTLMRLAMTDLFKAHWTDQIHDEWINALLRRGQHSRDALEKVRELMDFHARDAKVSGYESLIEGLSLPDPDDRHVLAAAIHCGADAIVTSNLKDFPTEALQPHGIEVIHPDDFIFYQIDMAPSICCSAIRDQRMALRNPELDIEALLAVLLKQQLPQTVAKLREYTNFL